MLRGAVLFLLFLVCLGAATSTAKWADGDVSYLLSDEERKEFKKLPDDAARERFIDEFWEVRNPARGTGRNPFKEEHYRRVQYANEHFGFESGTPGWMTDMGRTYILFGPPASKFPVKGYSQIYPLELWFYSNHGNPSMPPFYYVLFYIPDDIGSYRFYRPGMDGPMALVRGTQFQSNKAVYNFLKPLGGDLAHAAFSLDPNEPMDLESYSTNLSSDKLVYKIQNWANDSFNLKRIREARALNAKVTSTFAVVQTNTLNIQSIVLADPEGRYWLDYAALISSEELGHTDPKTKQFMVANSFRLLTDKGDLVMEDSEDRAYPAVDSDGKFRPFFLANRLPLTPGKYRLEVSVTNRAGGRAYQGEKSIEVGAELTHGLNVPLLAAEVQSAARPDATAPFQYFGAQFLPAAEARFSPASSIRVLFQVELPKTESGALMLDYLIASNTNRNVRQTISDPVAAGSLKEGRLLTSKTLPLRGYEDGEYRLVISLHREGSPEVLASRNVAFRIGGDERLPSLYFAGNVAKMANPGIAAYLRGLSALAQHDGTGAREYLRAAYEGSGHNAQIAQLMVNVYFHDKQYGPIAELYGASPSPELTSSPETLAQVALSLWRAGKKQEAQALAQKGQTLYPQNKAIVQLLAAMK